MFDPRMVYHYGVFEETADDIKEGVQVLLTVDNSKRKLHSSPYVEYKDTVPQAELQRKQQELELEANNLISKGEKVLVAIYSYEEVSKLCGGGLPDYIPKGSTPRIVKLGDFPGCPCGGTHVSDVSVGHMKVTQMRTKKGITKVYYQLIEL